MTSKWIDEIKKVLDENHNIYEWTIYDELQEPIERIDKLLREAMNETDNEDLHDKIKKELNGAN